MANSVQANGGIKTPDVDNHTDIFPIPFKALQANPHLVQNKGY